MVPTYILPYLGSNSTLINLVSAAIQRGMSPQWWLHAWCLVMLAVVASIRGKLIGKPYLLAFPVIALIFDLTPVLSSVPLVPTIMHVLALVLGVVGVKTALANESEESALPISFGNARWVAIAMTVATAAGIAYFAMANSKPSAKPQVPQAAAKAQAAPIPPDKPIAKVAEPERPSSPPATEVQPVKQEKTTQAPAKPKEPKVAPSNEKAPTKPQEQKIRYIDLNAP